MAKTVLSIRNLKKLYKNNRGVRDITLKIEEGDVVGLLGPNGSGKTTAMKAVIGMCSVDDGDIHIFGHDIDTEFEAAMEDVGALIEAPAIYENMTAYQNLKLASRFYPKFSGKQAEQRILEVLRLVNLEDYANDKAGRFSLGMKQRLGIALALFSKPRLVILDEPTNGLDIEGVVHIRSVIKEMSEKEGVTFLIAGHIASELEKTCTKAAVINDGVVLAYDNTEKILETHPSLEDYFLSTVGRGVTAGGEDYAKNNS